MGTQVPALTGRRLWIVYSVVVLVTFLAALDQTIVATALPRIVADVDGFDQLSWVVSAYLLAATVTVPLYGRLSDVYGRRRLLLISISLFLAGSMLCGTAQSMDQLIAFRTLQGLGAGGLLPLGQAVVADLFSPRERGKHQGVIGGAWAVAALAGPLLGGTLTDHASWRWIFYLNVPLALVALVVVLRNMPPGSGSGPRRIDYLGVVLLSIAVTGILLACVWGGVTYPWTSPQILVTAIGGAVLLVAFVWWERRTGDPLVPIGLFANRVFAISCMVNLVLGGLVFGVTIYVPLFVQGVLGASATSSGVVVLPMLLGWVGAAAAIGVLVSRTGRYKIFPLVGGALAIASAALLIQIDASTSRTEIAIVLLVFGVGMGATSQIYMLATQNAVGIGDIGVASAGVQFFRNIGASLAVAAFGTVLANRFASELVARLGDGASGVDARALLEGGADVPRALERGTQLALSASLHDVYLVLLPLAALAFALAALLPELPLRTSSRRDEASHGPEAAPARL